MKIIHMMKFKLETIETNPSVSPTILQVLWQASNLLQRPGSIPAVGPLVDEFLSPGLNFEMFIIFI